MKKQHYMTEKERVRLEAFLRAGKTVAWIAEEMGFCERTIYYEKKRGTYLHTVEKHGFYRDERRYSADKGQDIHRKAMRYRGRERKAAGDPAYLDFLEHKILKERYSPAAALASARRAGFTTTVCVTTLYTYIDSGVFRKLSNIHLLEKVSRKPRKKKDDDDEPKIAHKDLPSIEQRPEVIGQRSERGHWEMDLVIGKQKTHACLLTLTERRSRQEMIFKLPNKQAASVRAVFDKLEKRMGKRKFREMFRSITTDNGSEFLEYSKLTRSIYSGPRFEVWYCHPYSAWEKGTNENHNRMIRRFFPKGTDFTKVTPKQVAAVRDWMNNYPRKILGWKTPNEAA